VPYSAILDAALCALAGIPIISYDVRHHLITNVAICRFCLGVLALKSIESLVNGGHLISAISGGLCSLGIFLGIYWLSGSSLGLGDVKLAAVLGSLVEPWSIRTLILWTLMIWLWGGAHALISAIWHKSFRERIAFAPSLIMGTLTYLAMGIWSSLPQ
jgi:leader peptidase (prepilin peptidase)/N-methyltransferase